MNSVCTTSHFCFISSSDEDEWQVMTPFVRRSMARHRRLTILTHRKTREQFMSELQHHVPQSAELLNRGQIHVVRAIEMFEAHGPFSMEVILKSMEQSLDRSQEDGFEGWDVIGDMAWALDNHIAPEVLASYEHRMNRWIRMIQKVNALCIYPRSIFSPEYLSLQCLCHDQLDEHGEHIPNPMMIETPEGRLFSIREMKNYIDRVERECMNLHDYRGPQARIAARILTDARDVAYVLSSTEDESPSDSKRSRTLVDLGNYLEDLASKLNVKGV